MSSMWRRDVKLVKLVFWWEDQLQWVSICSQSASNRNRNNPINVAHLSDATHLQSDHNAPTNTLSRGSNVTLNSNLPLNRYGAETQTAAFQLTETKLWFAETEAPDSGSRFWTGAVTPVSVPFPSVLIY